MEKVLILLVIIIDLKISWCRITLGISAAMIVIYLGKKKKKKHISSFQVYITVWGRMFDYW